jgi:hypothetical protein
MNTKKEIINKLNLVINDFEMLKNGTWDGGTEGINVPIKELNETKTLVRKLQEKPINKVTTQLLDLALRMVGLYFEETVTDNIIDLTELIEEKGGKTTMKDIIELQTKWKNK